MSTTDMIDVEVILTLSVPIPADPAERLDIYGTSHIEECMQIDFDNDPVALLLDSTIVGFEAHLPPPPPPAEPITLEVQNAVMGLPESRL